MDNFNIELTNFTPKVDFDASSGELSITGKSLPEDARTFYKPLINWIHDLENTPLPSVHLSVELSYFNSSSTKQILKIFYALEGLQDVGKKINVSWLAKGGDSMIIEKGEEFNELINLPFKIEETSK